MIKPLSAFSEVVDEQRRWKPDWYSWLNELADPPVVSVASLPTSAVPGTRAFATDVTTVTFGNVPTGGGANSVPVYFDGAVWRIG